MLQSPVCLHPHPPPLDFFHNFLVFLLNVLITEKPPDAKEYCGCNNCGTMDTLEESFSCKATKYLGPGGTLFKWEQKKSFYIFGSLTENCILDKPLMAGILRKDVLEINLRYEVC